MGECPAEDRSEPLPRKGQAGLPEDSAPADRSRRGGQGQSEDGWKELLGSLVRPVIVTLHGHSASAHEWENQPISIVSAILADGLHCKQDIKTHLYLRRFPVFAAQQCLTLPRSCPTANPTQPCWTGFPSSSGPAWRG